MSAPAGSEAPEAAAVAAEAQAASETGSEAGAGAATGGGEGREGTLFPAERALATVSGRIPGRTLLLWLALIAVGGAGFLVAVGDDPTRAWGTAWANFLFWTALAQAGVAFGAALQTAKGHWGKGFRRIAEGMGAFLPLSVLLLAALLTGGAEHVFPWLGNPDVHVNREWLTPEGVLWRNVGGLALLTLVSFWYLGVSLRPDAPLVAGKLDGWRASLMGWIGRGWRGPEREIERARRVLGWSSPVLILLWFLVFSLLAFDLIMSLMPGFLSVIWGWYYVVGGWLTMLALMAVLVHRYRGAHGLDREWGKWQIHDLGKLLFAFTIFWTYFWWSQYLVIWYGNLPFETVFFEQRTTGGWGPLYWTQMVLIFGAPFVLLLFRRPKMRTGYVAGVALLTLAGFWLERHLLVLPSLEGMSEPVLGWVEIAVSLGFVGLFGLAYSTWASLVPKLPIHEVLPGGASTGP